MIPPANPIAGTLGTVGLGFIGFVIIWGMNTTPTLLTDVAYPAPRLHGVALAPTTLYYRRFPGDARELKLERLLSCTLFAGAH